MPDRPLTIDRRTLLKTMGAAGASATVLSACGPFSPERLEARGLTGAEFDKSIRLATAGPGGNPNAGPGWTMRFVPPEEIPTNGSSSV